MRNGPYELVLAPEDYPGKKYRDRYVYEHHLVWWQNTGEVVVPPMLIHHENEQKRDNSFENLRKKHTSAHTREHNIERPKKHPVPTIMSCAYCGRDFEVLGRNVPSRRKAADNHCSRSCSVKHQWAKGQMGSKTN